MILDKIIGNINILVISFTSSSEYTCYLAKCFYSAGILSAVDTERGCTIEALESRKIKSPVVVVFTGYGIIVKEKSLLPEKIKEKIEAGTDEFMWNDTDGSISLLRKDQVKQCEGSFAAAKIRIIGRVVCPFDSEDTVLGTCTKYLRENINFGRLFKPDPVATELCMAVFQRTKLAVLVAVLIFLAANYFRSDRIETEYSRVQAEYHSLQNYIGSAGELYRQKNEFTERYNVSIPYGFSWICDRLALVLPQSASLTSLKIQPLMVKLEEGKQVRLESRRVEITGNAINTEDVMRYIGALKQLNFAREVKMVSLEQDRNSSDLIFNISLDL
ncbi:MAG: PilN domain-containing protein [Rikenellaceae bacterium]|nr:PilN domain-containing protein [Rikenellaceae bacterium]